MDKNFRSGEENTKTSADGDLKGETGYNEKESKTTSATDADTYKEETTNRKYKSVVIRNLLISATLTTALVSWFTTAQGLEMYIFQGNYLFAGLISAAVQGLLYTLSISGISLLHSKRIKGIGGKISLIVLWLFLLLTSISFSYVYISKTAYPDSIMRKDAEMSLDLYVEGESEELLSYINKLEDLYSKQMSEYISQFGSSAGGGFDVAEDDKAVFESEKNSLIQIHEDNKDSEIEAILMTSEIQRGIDKLKTGNYSIEDFNAYTSSLEKKIEEVNERIKKYNSEYEEKRDEKTDLDNRLETFTNKEIWEYYKVLQDRDSASGRRDECLKIKGILEKLLVILTDCQSFATTEFEKGTESELHRKSVLLMEEMNKETIDTSLIMSYAEALYRIMIEENISVNDPRIQKYAAFRLNVRDYNTIIDVKQDIERELSYINSYSELFTQSEQNVSSNSIAENFESRLDSQSVSNEYSENKIITSNSTERTTLATHHNGSSVVAGGSEFENNEEMLEEDTVLNDSQEYVGIQDEAWIAFWSNRLSALQSEIKRLPSEVYLDEKTAPLQLDTKVKLKSIADRKRLYLTKLNDFDRAVSLLFETIIGLHSYGTMIIVSVFFAMGLDLFSLSAGILLYFYRPTRKDKRG